MLARRVLGAIVIYLAGRFAVRVLAMVLISPGQRLLLLQLFASIFLKLPTSLQPRCCDLREPPRGFSTPRFGHRPAATLTDSSDPHSDELCCAKLQLFLTLSPRQTAQRQKCSASFRTFLHSEPRNGSDVMTSPRPELEHAQLT